MIVGVTKNHDVRQALEESMSIGAQYASQKDRVLVEDKRTGNRLRMGDLLEGLPEHSRIRNQTAVVIHNLREYISQLDETTKLVSIGDFEKYAFQMVRALFPNLAAHNLASVQPMAGPISLVFYQKFVYGQTKGTAVAGTDIIENPNENYSSDVIDEEYRAIGNGADATRGAGTLDYHPVQPGTFRIYTVASAADVEATDDGNGTLVGDIVSGTIVYSTGVVTITWTTAPDLDAEVYATYSYDSEGNENVPPIDLQLTSAPVRARTRKLVTRWSLEAAQDLRNLHGLEAEVEQVAAVTNNLKFEIDQELINDMYRIASNSVATWSKTPSGGPGVGYPEWKLTFIDKLTEASNAIFQATQRALGTWVVCGINVASVIETLPGFIPSPRPRGTRGVYKCGTLNGMWEIWKNPNFNTNRYLMGFQGVEMYETGYIFCPYILAFPTATIMLDDFIGRKGMASRYGKKAIEGKFFCTGDISA